ncbi:hypothetical protein [Nocardioides sp.]|uniref:hypothetical protein n=1 Tax=Nocardioides sp. TaxID=35761 RepID=UPI002BA13864|nr:hypothetical protein [Nocardioides sp.]HXH77292.1 hypothetical protein [Nocardioides sp.]
MTGAGNTKHQVAVEKTADLVAQLQAEISSTLTVVVDLVGRLEDLADTRQSVGLGFMTEQTKDLANKQTRADRAAARNLHPARAHVGLKFLNGAAVLGSGQVEAPVTMNPVSVVAEIHFAVFQHLRRLSRPALLRLLEHEQIGLEDHAICPWPRNPISTTALDVNETNLKVLADRLSNVVSSYRNRPNLQAILRDLEQLEERARDVIDGPSRTNHPDACPWCGRRTLVILHREFGRDVQVVRCEGTHACVCDHEFCDCHRNPTRNRHEWVNSGRAAHTWHALHNLQTARKETIRMETLALDAITRIRAMHQPFWIDGDGDSRTYYVLIGGDEIDQYAPDHVCIDIGTDACQVYDDEPASSLHSVPGCIECQVTHDNSGQPGNRLWPCATYRATQLETDSPDTRK